MGVTSSRIRVTMAICLSSHRTVDDTLPLDQQNDKRDDSMVQIYVDCPCMPFP